MTDASPFGCGRRDCTAPKEYCTEAQPRAPVDPAILEKFGPGREAAAIAALDASDRRAAHHEAGHVVAAALFDISTPYAVMGPTPHVMFSTGGRTTEEILAVTRLAGRVAENYSEHRVLSPCKDEMTYFITKAKDGTSGDCDECQVAQLLLISRTNEPDKPLLSQWQDYFRRTAAIFDNLYIRSAVTRVARELQSKRRLDRDELDRLVGHLRPGGLQAPKAA